jgi:hypothetical protein
MNYITRLLTLQNQLRIFHWQCDKHSQHESFGKTYEELDPLIDSFIEEFMGLRGKIKKEGGFNIELKNFDEIDYLNFLNEYINYLIIELPQNLSETDTNLFNLRDEILGSLQKLKYLLTQQ